MPQPADLCRWFPAIKRVAIGVDIRRLPQAIRQFADGEADNGHARIIESSGPRERPQEVDIICRKPRCSNVHERHDWFPSNAVLARSAEMAVLASCAMRSMLAPDHWERKDYFLGELAALTDEPERNVILPESYFITEAERPSEPRRRDRRTVEGHRRVVIAYPAAVGSLPVAWPV